MSFWLGKKKREPGLILGKYQVGERLGKGGMAEVFRVRLWGAEGFSRTLALKRISPKLSDDEHFARLFIQEARMASRLSHPNILSVIDFDRDEEGTLFLVMELVDGSDLKQIMDLARKKLIALPPALAAYVIEETLVGLAYAHEFQDKGMPQGIVHRDVSPHNVFVSRTGAVKIGDFGIAKARAEASPLTQQRLIVGKLPYMAPEQMRGEPLDGRADVYAAGVTLYELLCGERPYQGTDNEIVAQVFRAKAMPIDHRVQIPADLAEMTMCLMAGSKNNRYPSARKAAESLRACSCFPKNGRERLAEFIGRVLAPMEVSQAHRVPVYRYPKSSSQKWLLGLAFLATASASAAITTWLTSRSQIPCPPLQPPR